MSAENLFGDASFQTCSSSQNVVGAEQGAPSSMFGSPTAPVARGTGRDASSLSIGTNAVSGRLRKIEQKRKVEKEKRARQNKSAWRVKAAALLKGYLITLLGKPDSARDQAQAKSESLWDTVASTKKELLVLVRQFADYVERKKGKIPLRLGRYLVDFIFDCSEEDGRPLFERFIPYIGESTLRGFILVPIEIVTEPFPPLAPLGIDDLGLLKEHRDCHPLFQCMSNGCLWPFEVMSDRGSADWCVFFSAIEEGSQPVSLVVKALQQGLLREYCDICPRALPAELLLDNSTLFGSLSPLLSEAWGILLERWRTAAAVSTLAVTEVLRWAVASPTVADTVFEGMVAKIPRELESRLEGHTEGLLRTAIRVGAVSKVKALLPVAWGSCTEARQDFAVALAMDFVLAAFSKENGMEPYSMGQAHSATDARIEGIVPVSTKQIDTDMEGWALEILRGESPSIPLGEKERPLLLAHKDKAALAVFRAATVTRAVGLEATLDMMDRLDIPATHIAANAFQEELTDQISAMLLERLPIEAYCFGERFSIVTSTLSSGRGDHMVSILRAHPNAYNSAPSCLLSDILSVGSTNDRFRISECWEHVLTCFRLLPSEITKTSGGHTLLHVAAAYFPLEGVQEARNLVPASMTAIRNSLGRLPCEMKLALPSMEPDERREILLPTSMVKRADI